MCNLISFAMRFFSFFLLSVFVLFSSGCTVRTGFFTADAYLRPHQVEVKQPLTIIIDQYIPNDLSVGQLQVTNFRHSLKISLYHTFEYSVPKIVFADSVATEGITLQLFRVRPDWQVADRRSGFLVVDGNGGSYTDTDVISIIRYDGIIYHDGQKKLALDELVESETAAIIRRDLPEVFQDGVRELCEDVYQKVTQQAVASRFDE
ncbi:MAG: hypothetical protein AAF944_24260 [Bacteroidota bacterium]